jgi:hypothetical protein
VSLAVIKHETQKLLEEYGLTLDMMCKIVTDSGATVKSAMSFKKSDGK